MFAQKGVNGLEVEGAVGGNNVPVFSFKACFFKGSVFWVPYIVLVERLSFCYFSFDFNWILIEFDDLRQTFYTQMASLLCQLQVA